MRIVFVISCYSSVSANNGGHYYSARDLAYVFGALWENTDIRIVVLGDRMPLAFPSSADALLVNPAGKSIIRFFREALSAIQQNDPTHIHCFDNKSFLFGRISAIKTGARLFLTKPGGPNPGWNFPKSPVTFFFSEENYNFSRKGIASHSKVFLIPQRVITPKQDELRKFKLRDSVGRGDFILRICRIGTYYRNSIVQAINITRALRATIDLKCVVIGTVESQSVLDELLDYADGDATFITDKEFTASAAELISEASAVLGTGRGAIEAGLLGLPVLTPLSDSEFPALVDAENFDALASTNFSERNVLPNYKVDIDSVARAIFSRQAGTAPIFKSRFSVEEAAAKYHDVYMSPQQKLRIDLSDIAINSLSFIHPYVKLLGMRLAG